MHVETDRARTNTGDLAHRLATPIATLRLCASALGAALPELLAARGDRPFPPEIATIIPVLPERLAQLAEAFNQIRMDLPTLLGLPPETDLQALRATAADQPAGERRPYRDRGAPSILLVEDDPDSSDLMCMALQCQGWVVAHAGDGRPALELLAQQRFDLILMDSRLPELDGWETTLRLRAAGPNRDTPVVGLTASPDPTERAHGLSVGMDDWLVKPLTGAHLTELKRRFLTPAPTQP